MRVLPEALTIVLAGTFNPAILSPQWVSRFGLQVTDERTFRVEMIAPVTGLGGMPRFGFDGITYAPNFQNVTFFVGDKTREQQQLATVVASRILTELPHTPVSGVGFNFAFETRSVNERLLNLHQSNPGIAQVLQESEIVARKWGHSISWRDALVSAECELQADAATLNFNFHHNVASASAAAGVLSTADIYAQYYGAAVALAQQLTGEDLEAIE